MDIPVSDHIAPHVCKCRLIQNINIICSNVNNNIPNSSRRLTVATVRTKVKQDVRMYVCMYVCMYV